MKLHSSNSHNQRSQLSSFVLFVSVIILINLCPPPQVAEQPRVERQAEQRSIVATLSSQCSQQGAYLAAQLELSLRFVKLMFTNPMRLGQRSTRFTLAEAKMLGKVAKVLILKKKLKKFGKKLKKHTIAVPVFTAIPIYEHSYYPAPHVTHLTHGHHMHHAAAASSYSPVALAAPPTAGQPEGQLAASASNSLLQRAYRPHHMHGGHQIINAYAPSPPMYVDENGGLYGTYGNAYGRYDGGFHIW